MHTNYTHTTNPDVFETDECGVVVQRNGDYIFKNLADAETFGTLTIWSPGDLSGAIETARAMLGDGSAFWKR